MKTNLLSIALISTVIYLVLDITAFLLIKTGVVCKAEPIELTIWSALVSFIFVIIKIWSKKSKRTSYPKRMAKAL